ncbi:DUF5801 repeats-in-toxin domain-containing protein [Roseibium salinum]|uniref:DUF5801 domain-containing protein n=1 Tax=Roseibium salinum TaxID=1604349 RepID=A0ABT3QVF0_9HYPH|nr:DUF5801 repeats-in-toxin domain-containing protein [Roseibium sp. DSM 29163]MCX2720879.1 DUF5801 domain-containing protein [Roseibium sp. DSM 29163]
MGVTSTGKFVVLDESEELQNYYESMGIVGDEDDNDIATDRLPLAFSGRLGFYSLTLDEAALSGYGDAMTDAASDEGDYIVTVDSEVTDLSLAANSDGDAFTAYGANAVSTFSSGHFTVGGDEIYFFADPTDSNIVYGVAGNTADGDGTDIVLAIYLEEVLNTDGDIVAAKMWTVLMEGYTLAHDDTADSDDSLDFTNKLFVAATSEVDFDFGGAPPGNNLFMWFGDLDQAIIVTGRDPANQSEGENISSGDTVNTSGQAVTSLGTNGQQVKAGEGMYFTYVSGSTSTPDPNEFIVPNLDQTEADVEANITFDELTDATGGTFSISQVNPGNTNTTVAIRITAYTTDDEPGTGFVDGLGDSDDVAVSISGITINGVAVAFSVDGDSVIVDGVKSGDVVGFTTDGVHQRLLIENAQPTSGQGSNLSFDLGGFSLIQVSTASEEIGSKVVIEDDGPDSGGDQAVPILELDESPLDPDGDGLWEVTEGMAGSFGTPDFGTDGEASVTYVFVPFAEGALTGLYALNPANTGMGDPIRLYLSDDEKTITGSTALLEGNVDAGNTYFTIEVDGVGDVTFTRLLNIWHGDTADPDDQEGISAAAGTIVLQQTIVEGDGDSLVTELDLSNGIFFIADDGPAIDLTSLSPTIAVDESVGTAGSSKDEPGNAAPDDETHANAPGGAIGYAETSAASLFSETADAGTDGEDSKVYALVLTAGATGLTDTASGEAVVLSEVGGVIEGRTDIGGDLVFTIEVDANTGDVTTALFRSLDHGADLNDHDSAVSMASGLVELEATLTDGDADKASDKIELGSLIEFEDDGPAIDLTALSPTIAVDESVGTAGSSQDEPGNAAPDDETHANAPGNAIGYAETSAASLFSETADAGTDGEDSKVYALVLNAGATGLTDTASGEAVVLSETGGVIEGRTDTGGDLVFTIEVDANTGDVTTTLYRSLDHGPDLNDHDSAVSMAAGLVELEATLTDGDTDTASDKIELGSLIEFEDDGPLVTVEDTSQNSADTTATYGTGAEGDWADDPGSDDFDSAERELRQLSNRRSWDRSYRPEQQHVLKDRRLQLHGVDHGRLQRRRHGRHGELHADLRHDCRHL